LRHEADVKCAAIPWSNRADKAVRRGGREIVCVVEVCPEDGQIGLRGVVDRHALCRARRSHRLRAEGQREGRDAGHGELPDPAERHALRAIGDVVGDAEDGAAGTGIAGPEIGVDGTARAWRDGRARTGVGVFSQVNSPDAERGRTTL
jgi:hypothetical protein